MLSSPIFRKYFVPGFIFQSIVIGGGYGTGRELVEFFLSQGPLPALLGMLVATLIWSAVLAISFELARMGKYYDYRSFIGGLLGRGWLAYEVVYLVGLVLVVAVMGSAAGEILNQMLGIPEVLGISIMIVIVGILTFFGTNAIERILSLWSMVLYVGFLTVIVAGLLIFGDEIGARIGESGDEPRWILGGVRYAAYNVGLMPAMLFALRHLETRREAMISGAMAGLIAMIPGVMIVVVMIGAWPEILDDPVPIITMIQQMDLPVLLTVIQIVLFGTFIETGVGIVHGFNERVAGVYREKGSDLTPKWRAAIAVALLVVSIFVADKIGIVALIASGYGTLTWGYWLVFVGPVLTIGVYRLWQSSKSS